MRRPSNLFLLLCGALLCFVLGVLAGGRFFARRGTDTVQSDTLYLYREFRDSAAILASTRAAGYEVVRCGSLDSLRRAADKPARVVREKVTETVEVTVTKDRIIYASVPMSEQTWTGSHDSVDYRITTTGYHVQLGEVSFRYPEMIVTRTVDRTRKLGFDITAGPSVLVTPAGGVKGGVGITAGISWRF